MNETYVVSKPCKDNKKGADNESNTIVGTAERGGNIKARSVAKSELNILF